MKKTTLYEKHLNLGARMISFSGWKMPVRYSTIIDEHNTVRAAVGLFDISHMGLIEISGGGAIDYLQCIMTFDISRIAELEAHYSLLCYEDGTIIDDTFIYHKPAQYLIVVNAVNTDKVISWLMFHAPGFDIKIKNISNRTGLLTLQGPKAESVLQKITGYDLSKIKNHQFIRNEISGITTLIARTGYTGEDGFELFLPIDKISDAWEILIEAGNEFGIKPVGLGARDTLRLEAGMRLYGHELSPNINPYEARLGWVVSLDKGIFIGKESLLKVKLEGVSRRLVGFKSERGKSPRNGHEIWSENDHIGQVTSGMFSPTLKGNYGLGYVPRSKSIIGTKLDIKIGDQFISAEVVRIPFYKTDKGR